MPAMPFDGTPLASRVSGLLYALGCRTGSKHTSIANAFSSDLRALSPSKLTVKLSQFVSTELAQKKPGIA